MKIIADKEIPYVEYFFRGCGDLVLMDAESLTHRNLQTADMLLVRSVTKVNPNLFKGTKIKYVGSPTTGFDHFDVEWLKKAGIFWTVAPGCNATAVSQYVLCAIAGLQKKGFLANRNLRAGVIGVGRIGKQVAEKLEILGFKVLLCDPYRADNESTFESTQLEEFRDLDLITIHTPLTNEGPYPTYHMINYPFLFRQKENCILMNTSRGAVIQSNDLKMSGQQLIWCLDVFENEPNIDFGILDTALIATPHIAGYTVQSKMRGTEMLYQTFLQNQIIPENSLEKLPVYVKTLQAKVTDWRDVLLQVYDPFATTAVMKEKVIEENGKAFTLLRNNFIEETERPEFDKVNLQNVILEKNDTELLKKIGFSI